MLVDVVPLLKNDFLSSIDTLALVDRRDMSQILQASIIALLYNVKETIDIANTTPDKDQHAGWNDGVVDVVLNKGITIKKQRGKSLNCNFVDLTCHANPHHDTNTATG